MSCASGMAGTVQPAQESKVFCFFFSKKKCFLGLAFYPPCSRTTEQNANYYDEQACTCSARFPFIQAMPAHFMFLTERSNS
jgi:hypothetical protein